MTSDADPPPAEPLPALDAVEASIAAAWESHRRAHSSTTEAALAACILEDPSRHPWRIVEAALGRSRCPRCGASLGTGRRGCPPCDEADGYRFAAREPDRPGVRAGNEHAIRVSTAVLRSPGRYPAWAVAANRLLLPLFLQGEMPTRAQQEALLAASRRGLAVDATGARTFAELAERALAAVRSTGDPPPSAGRPPRRVP